VLQRHDMDKTRQTLLNALNPVAASTLASSSVLHSNPPPEPIFPSAIMPSLLQISLMNVSPLELARQLTIYVHTVYRRISPLECVITSFTGPEKEVRSPNLTALTTMFNDHSYWAASYILNSSDLVHRVQVLEFFITVAVELRTLQNFMTMYAILCGIRSTPVRRLKLTWERVSKSKVQQFDALVEIMQSNGNFASYRNLLRQALPPVCPYIGTFLTDLVFIEEGNPDFLKEQPTFINFCKRIRSAQIVQKILHYCQEPYNLVVIPAFQEMFTELIIFDENRRYELSYALEARGSQQ
jgi:son of sevenless-like protein